ncbi:putative serine/threonine-protein kinase pknG [Nostocoides japonicum T1-X7]|uniref:non-specific serine/threonine protein kinase n=1 Tax=Nostocoides japonicum T1-X7 TaxID=1194083 RepID=A0A077LXE0_9MICO|nr:serine/threonine-protein kinase [Tetrasphaera japonica]CCH77557.1 putative serine/threonine-protein kinase pknG [Tetrasphaera japonica T1-X7]
MASAQSTPTTSASIRSAPIGSRRAGAGTTATRRVGSSRTRAARLGAGLTTVPPAPPVDPAGVVQTHPEVPEEKRFCSSCGAAVGRSVGDRPGRPEGFCPKCGAPYSFTPKLAAGDLVAGQYLVAGALAHGGLGWIYLARDRNVSDRWVVLKGLLNSGDQDALAAAIAEQRFLAQVEHPTIVEIYNFVTHDDAGYIVMEYVGGQSLKQILKERMRATGGAYDPLPVDQALAYIIEILPAFQYLHDLGLVYCDFKPDNLIQVGDAVKLIDLGGVRRIDDEESAIYGTVGYQAPEVAEEGTSVASDIYTIGRTLVVLTMEFRGYQSTYLHSLPDPATTPVFRDHDSFSWLVAKCCAREPADRFASAEELRVQALGVLREVVAGRTAGTSLTSTASVNFSTPTVSTDRIEWHQLPALGPDTTDPQYSWLVGLAPGDPDSRLRDLEQAPGVTAEVLLARGMEQLRAGRPAAVAEEARRILTLDPWDWRALWLQGLASLQARDWADAQASFSAVYQQVPGELAPKLALAVACEAGGQGDIAEGLYRTCVQTDAAYVAPAAFGLARLRAAAGDTKGAVAALDLVPSTSRGYGDSRRLRAGVLLAGAGRDLGVLDAALRSIDGVRLDVVEREMLTARILEQAVAVVGELGPQPEHVGPYAAQPDPLRSGLEASYRALAREAPTREDRIALVDRANDVRPWTLT